VVKSKQSLQSSTPPDNAKLCSYFGAGSCIVGTLSFGGDAHIEGAIFGNVGARGKVTIAKCGRVTSEIKANSVLISGEVKGDVFASERIKICGTATVFGDLTSRILIVEQGARFEGHLSTICNDEASHNCRNESEPVQVGLSIKAGEKDLSAIVPGFRERERNDTKETVRRLGIRELVDRLATVQCNDCLRPIRWWNRRVWIADYQYWAHAQCWQGQLFFRGLIAHQIRCSQLSAGENSESYRNQTSEPHAQEVPAVAPPSPQRIS
jgi:cytoskeletal protein CcmA (bactofilin family)